MSLFSLVFFLHAETLSTSKEKREKKSSHPAARVEHDRAELARAGHGLGEVGERGAVEVEGAPLW